MIPCRNLQLFILMPHQFLKKGSINIRTHKLGDAHTISICTITNLTITEPNANYKSSLDGKKYAHVI